MEALNRVINFINTYPLVIVAVWLLICIIIGYTRGFAKQIYQFVVVIISVVFTFGFIRNVLTGGIFAMGYTQIAIFIAIILVLNIIGNLSGLINKIPVLGHLNRFLGAVLGFVIGAIIALVVYLIF